MKHEYNRVWIDGKNVYEHRHVWSEAHGEIPEGMTIDHINGNKRDNRLENLQLLTQAENSRRAYRGSVSKLSGKRSRPFDAHRKVFDKIYRKTFGTPGGAWMFNNTCLLGGT